MNKVSIKYKSGISSGAIQELELKYNLKRESMIPVLRIYGYTGGTGQMAAIKKEAIVEYVEKQQEIGLPGS